MWLRHALKLVATLIIFSACSPSDRQTVDKLNSISYAYHYRSLDSTAYYAQKALSLSTHYSGGEAEALNNLAFVSIMRMEYSEAKKLLDKIPDVTDNQLELLVCNIQQMRLCQRMSHNREFYDYREKSNLSLKRINEERNNLSEKQKKRLLYAETEFSIVNSTYYYYVGLEQLSVDAMSDIKIQAEQDTAQYLNYLYNIGAGGIINKSSQEEINQTEFDYLMHCYLMAEQSGYTFFIANTLESIAEHLLDSASASKLITDNLPAFKFLNHTSEPFDLLPIKLAEDALSLFIEYGDTYQIAGAYRTLASCYLTSDNYEEAIHHLNMALADSTIEQAPDLVASIREQMSVAYSAIDNKQQSDYNRNIYLDLQEQTRQDRSMEARAGQLEKELGLLNRLLIAIGVSLIVLICMVTVFYKWQKRRIVKSDNSLIKEQEEELKESLAISRLHLENSERRYQEQRAKISLANSILPFIDRMLHEVNHLHDSNTKERLNYICELTDKINEQNDILTHWIQLRQGELNLQIESFSLNEVFDIVKKSSMSFEMKGVKLFVDPTESYVKADKILTLFMINTLADNARKFTEAAGYVTIKAEDINNQCVEISVTDTGCGMDESQLANVFNHKISEGHGFGLLNCKDIIEKYKKVSKIFSICQITAESRLGEGSRFSFRLPRGIKYAVLFLLAVLSGNQSYASNIDKASIYADSAYFSNINGTYEKTLLFADSCRYYLNSYYIDKYGNDQDTLMAFGEISIMQPEIKWFHDSVDINYNIILDIRNESAVAALALHEWSLYFYNNKIYTSLFKELSADNTLAEYCITMQKSQTNKQIAIILLVILLIAIVITVVWQTGVLFNKSAKRHQENEDKLALIHDDINRFELEDANLHVRNAVLDNCLSTLKHETMYYPSRIRQLVEQNDIGSLKEVSNYYRELYGILTGQANRQIEGRRLHLEPLDNEILGNRVLISYLFEILRKQDKSKKLNIRYEAKDSKYIICEVKMSNLNLSEEQAAYLFSPSIENIPYLICRQIIRNHGDATNRRGCAIKAEIINQITTIIITLPRYVWKSSK